MNKKNKAQCLKCDYSIISSDLLCRQGIYFNKYAIEKVY